MSIAKRVAKNTFWLLTAEVTGRGLFMILTFLIARYLGAAGFGRYAFAFAFVTLFLVFTEFGLDLLTIREVAREKRLVGKYINNIACIKIILAIVTYVTICITIQFFNKTPETKIIVYLAGIYIIIRSFNDFFKTVFRAFEKMGYEALVQITEKVLLCFFALYVIFNDRGLYFLVMSFVFSSLVSFMLTLLLVWKRFSNFFLEIDFAFWKKLLKAAWPFALNSLFIIVYFKISTVILSTMRTDEAVGWFNAAYTLLNASVLLPNLLMGALFPAVSRLYSLSETKFYIIYKKFAKYLFVIALPICLVTSLSAKKITLVSFGAEYVNSTIALQIIIWAAFFIYLNLLHSTILRASNNQKITMIVSGICVTINIILNLYLINLYGHVGASLAVVLTEAISLILLLAVTARYLKFNIAINSFKKIIFSNLILLVFIYLTREMNILIILSGSIILYMGLLLMLKIIKANDKKLLRSVFKRDDF